MAWRWRRCPLQVWHRAQPNIKPQPVRAQPFDGTQSPSKAERDRYHYLLRLIQLGQIADLERQVVFHFPINGEDLRWNKRRVRYTCDFRYRDLSTGEIVHEDVKGMVARDVHLRLALMQAIHGITVRLITKG